MQSNTLPLTSNIASEGPTKPPSATNGRSPSSLLLSCVPAGLLPQLMSYLPLQDILRCRRTSRQFHAAVNADGSIFSPGSVFLRFAESTHRGRRFLTVHPDALRYSCVRCRTPNNLTLTHCRRCGLYRDNNGMRRLFLGQLRKADTTEHLEWLLAKLFPQMDVHHIEAHTTRDGRSKGCAWVYVDSDAHEQCLRSLHRRVYLDVPPTGHEGVWFVRDHEEDMNSLEALAWERSQARHRQLVLPRKPMICQATDTSHDVKSVVSAPKTAPSPPVGPPPHPLFGTNQYANPAMMHYPLQGHGQAKYFPQAHPAYLPPTLQPPPMYGQHLTGTRLPPNYPGANYGIVPPQAVPVPDVSRQVPKREFQQHRSHLRGPQERWYQPTVPDSVGKFGEQPHVQQSATFQQTTQLICNPGSECTTEPHRNLAHQQQQHHHHHHQSHHHQLEEFPMELLSPDSTAEPAGGMHASASQSSLSSFTHRPYGFQAVERTPPQSNPTTPLASHRRQPSRGSSSGGSVNSIDLPDSGFNSRAQRHVSRGDSKAF